MSLRIWLPFARLSYCAYLVHLMIIVVVFGIDHGVPHYSGVCELLEMKLLAGKRRIKHEEPIDADAVIEAVKTKI
ncbi:hypothetical protein ANCDUO_15526 [Ancylostoma duodenale]|uniref:Uncharacterized protein n=1 Tax=Ancylostoma duodenale TaxID=51022 RepID=A0A0C2G0C0_9BILA|nr:hypothetical protein ANCDUO_15526 [Ancylostoma duodenale]